jgi:hypothetical protein
LGPAQRRVHSLVWPGALDSSRGSPLLHRPKVGARIFFYFFIIFFITVIIIITIIIIVIVIVIIIICIIIIIVIIIIIFRSIFRYIHYI